MYILKLKDFIMLQKILFVKDCLKESSFVFFIFFVLGGCLERGRVTFFRGVQFLHKK